MDGVVQPNVPGTLAVPPESSEELNACPAVMAEAVGATVIVGVPLPTAIVTWAVVLPPALLAVTV